MLFTVSVTIIALIIMFKLQSARASTLPPLIVIAVMGIGQLVNSVQKTASLALHKQVLSIDGWTYALLSLGIVLACLVAFAKPARPRVASLEMDDSGPTEYARPDFKYLVRRGSAGLIDALIVGVAGFVWSLIIVLLAMRGLNLGTTIQVDGGTDKPEVVATLIALPGIIEAVRTMTCGGAELIIFTSGLVGAGMSADERLLLGSAAYIVIAIFVWLYFSIMESSHFQATLGKLVMGLQVTNLSGGRLSFRKAALRFFCRWFSGPNLLIGYLYAAFSPTRQTVHDLFVQTVVVRRQQQPGRPSAH